MARLLGRWKGGAVRSAAQAPDPRVDPARTAAPPPDPRRLDAVDVSLELHVASGQPGDALLLVGHPGGGALQFVSQIDHAFTELGISLVQAVDVLPQTGDDRGLLTVEREV